MYRIKCSNGKYVSKTHYGAYIDYTKHGKIYHSLKIVNRKLDLCNEYRLKRGCSITYEIEKLKDIL